MRYKIQYFILTFNVTENLNWVGIDKFRQSQPETMPFLNYRKMCNLVTRLKITAEKGLYETGGRRKRTICIKPKRK